MAETYEVNGINRERVKFIFMRFWKRQEIEEDQDRDG